MATVGAHITRPNAKNEDYKTHSYIVPMCVEQLLLNLKIFNNSKVINLIIFEKVFVGFDPHK